MRELLLLTITTFLIASCNEEQKNFPKVLEIDMYDLDSSIYIGRPLDLEYLDNWLVWQDHYEEHFYSGYRIDSKEFIRFAKVGKARDEFVMWPQGSISSFGMGLFNNQKKIYQIWDIDSVLINEDYFPHNNLAIEDSLGLTFTMIQRKDSSFISTGANEFGLIAFFDKKGKLVGTSGEYPQKNIAVSDKVHAIACLNSTHTFHPGLDKIVVGYLFSGHFEVFKLQENQAISEWKIDKFPFEYRVIDGKVRIPLSTKYGYVDIDCTDKFIYALFSGKAISSDSPTYTNTVEVYNWDGSPVAKLQLDTPVNLIAVSPDNKYIYSTGIQGNEVVLFHAELPTL